jgi:uncharacterized protein YdeI (YjbR/CyaY-like superfamily)
MKPRFFATPARFRAWLEKHHARAPELLVGFHKVGSGQPSLTWPQAVDEALCFGWIDGVRRSLGADSYVIRFTPRRPGSNWSLINVRKVGALTRAGKMRPAGRAAFAARRAERTGRYSFEQRKAPKFTAAQLRRFRANQAAWGWFQACPPGYRRVATHWVVSAAKPETRERRMGILIADCARGLRIGPLRRPGSV